jgi:hypothetical protein
MNAEQGVPGGTCKTYSSVAYISSPTDLLPYHYFHFIYLFIFLNLLLEYTFCELNVKICWIQPQSFPLSLGSKFSS